MKKVISLALALAMVLTLASFPVLAVDGIKVALSSANLTLNRIFDSGYVTTANFSNLGNMFDGNTGTYSEWDQYTGDGTTANMRAEFIVDLGEAKNLTEVTVRTGIETNVGGGWFDNASPMNAQILVSDDGVSYTSVFTYDSNTVEAARTDTVALNPEVNGAAVRYVKYTFNKVARRATIAEIEVYEQAPPREPVAIDVADVSISISGGTGVAKIIDGDYSSTGKYTSVNAMGPSGNPLFNVEFDLGAKYELTELIWVTDSGAMKNGTLYGSNTPGGGWTQIASFTNLTYTWDGSYDWKGYNVQNIDTNGAAYRYIKIEVTQIHSLDNEGDNMWDDPNVVEINEIELTGIPSQNSGVQPNMYYDVDAAAAAQGLGYTNAVLPASLFNLPNGYNAYKIDGTYKVDANTLRMLTTVPCTGNGTIKYKDYTNFTSYIATANPSWGQYNDQGYGADNYGEQIVSAPVSKLNDPVYMSMVLPSEGVTYMGTDRTNGNNMHKPSTDTVFDRLNTLGAVYVNSNLKNELAQNHSGEQLHLCIGNIKLLVKTASQGWVLISNVETPQQGFAYMYALPWQLEGQLGGNAYAQLCKSVSVETKNGYSRMALNVNDFLYNQTVSVGGSQTVTVDERVFHFWGDIWNLADAGIADTDILGMVVSYEMWIEEEELAPYFISSIGADWRLTSGSTRQAFAGYKHAVSSEKRTVIGHNIGQTAYDTLITANDLATIKGLIGIQ